MNANPVSLTFQLLKSVTFAVLDQADMPERTGFFFTKDGYALTALHGKVFRNGDIVSLRFNGRKLQAGVIQFSKDLDVAILHAPDARPDNIIPLHSPEMSIPLGCNVLVAGFQFAGQFGDLLPIPQQLDVHAPVQKVRFSQDDHPLECLILHPSGSGDKVFRGTSGGPVLYDDKASGILIGMIVGVGDDEQREEKVVKAPQGTVIVRAAPRPNYAFALPLYHLVTHLKGDWPALGLLVAKGLSYMAEAEDLHRQSQIPQRPLPVTMMDGRTLLPVPFRNLKIAQSCVTNDQFHEFVQQNHYWSQTGQCRTDGKVDDCYLAHWAEDAGGGISAHPVTHVSAFAAAAFLEWLSEKLGRNLRLPTPEELKLISQCARRETTWLYEDIAAGSILFKDNNSEQRPMEAAKGVPNPWGFYHAIGNVRQICRAQTHGNSFEAYGGSFNDTKSRLTRSLPLQPNTCRPDVGFRYVAETSDTTNKEI
jgi:formylglycine-generating enzyme required for sulfatase activity